MLAFVIFFVCYAAMIIMTYILLFKRKKLPQSIDNNFAGNIPQQSEALRYEEDNWDYGSDLPWWERDRCDNQPALYDTAAGENALLHSQCGVRAAKAGFGQKVVSFCLYGNYSAYARGFHQILRDIKIIFPGWLVRLHVVPQLYKNELCFLKEKYNNLYICDVSQLPGDFSDLSEVEPMLWRMAPLGDDQVDVFISRDIDSQVNSSAIRLHFLYIKLPNA